MSLICPVQLPVKSRVGVARVTLIDLLGYDLPKCCRTASEDCSPRPFKIRLCGTWDETRPSKIAAGRDVGFYSDDSLLKGRTHELKRKESCPSVFPPSFLTLNRRRCSSGSEFQLLTGSDRRKSTDDFLSLGLSSYSVSAQHEAEVSSQEAKTPDEIKQMDICSKECHDILELQLCNPQQAKVLPFYFHMFHSHFCNILTGDEGCISRRSWRLSFTKS